MIASRRLNVSRAMKQFVSFPKSSRRRSLAGLTERELIQRESEIGRDLFGPIAKGHRREFFNSGPRIWIWHEEWPDSQGKIQQLTTKYEVRDDGIWKVQPGPRYTKLAGEELTNFHQAASVYYERVMRDVYERNPTTGEKLL